MADPIRELILKDLDTVLAAVTGIEAAIRPPENANEVDERPAYVIRDLGDSDQVDGVQLESENTMQVEINTIVVEADPDKRVEDTALFQARAVEAIMADETRGGNAISTMARTLAVSIEAPAEPLGTKVVSLEVIYRIRKGDPFTKATT